MRMASPLSVSHISAIMLTAAIAIILVTANVPIATNAQVQQPLSTSRQAPMATTTPTQNATFFQSTEDSFRVQVPRGWVIHDFDNTGTALLTEVMQGYGILAQLCPEAGQPQAFRNVGTGSNTASGNSCQGSEQGIVHVIRYPNLGAELRLTPDGVTTNSNNTMNAILSYEMEKLQEVGYRDIKIVNSTNTTVKLDINSTGGTSSSNLTSTAAAASIPARLVEMTYTTNSAPSDIRTGYFILTATTVTPHNLGMMTGYSILYEGNPKAAVTGTTAYGSFPLPISIPTLVRQVFDSFELIAAQQVAHAITEAQPQHTAQSHQSDSGQNSHDNSHHNSHDNNKDKGTTCKIQGKAATSCSDDYGADCDSCDGTNNNNSNNQNRSKNFDDNDAGTDGSGSDDNNTGGGPTCVTHGSASTSASNDCE